MGRVVGIDDLGQERGSEPRRLLRRLALAGSSAMMVRIEARISSIDGSCARCARRSASRSRSLEFELIALIRPPCLFRRERSRAESEPRFNLTIAARSRRASAPRQRPLLSVGVLRPIHLFLT